jgi:hypothetical protein
MNLRRAAGFWKMTVAKHSGSAMMMRTLVVATFVLGLAGCQSSRIPSLFPQPAPPPPPPVVQPAPLPAPAPAASEPLVWGRKDCQRAANNPAIQASFGNDKSFCEKQANLKDGDGVNMAMVGCMDGRGYRYGTRAEHDGACARNAGAGNRLSRR